MQEDLLWCGWIWTGSLACMAGVVFFVLMPWAINRDADWRAANRPYFGRRIRALGFAIALQFPLFVLLLVTGGRIPVFGSSGCFLACYCSLMVFIVTSGILYTYYTRFA